MLEIPPENYSNFSYKSKETYILPIKSGGELQIKTASEKCQIEQGLYSVVYPLTEGKGGKPGKIAKLSHFGVTNKSTGLIDIADESLETYLVETPERRPNEPTALYEKHVKAARNQVISKMLEVANRKKEIHSYLQEYIPTHLLERDLMTIVESPRKALDTILKALPEDAALYKMIPEHEVSLLEIVEKIRFSLSHLDYDELKLVYTRPSIQKQLNHFANGALTSILQGGRMLDISDSHGVRILYKNGKAEDNTDLGIILYALTNEDSADCFLVPKNLGITQDKVNPRVVLYDEDPLHEIKNTPLHEFAIEISKYIKNEDYKSLLASLGMTASTLNATSISSAVKATGQVRGHIEHRSDKIAVASHLLLLKYLGADFNQFEL